MAPTYDSSVETLEKGIADHYRKHVFQGATGFSFPMILAWFLGQYLGPNLESICVYMCVICSRLPGSSKSGCPAFLFRRRSVTGE